MTEHRKVAKRDRLPEIPPQSEIDRYVQTTVDPVVRWITIVAAVFVATGLAWAWLSGG